MDNVTPIEKQQLLQELPSIDRLLRLPVTIDLMAEYGRSLTLEFLRNTLNDTRQAVLNGTRHEIPANAMLVQITRERLAEILLPTLRPVINATGVIVHTNLGRAPLSQATRQAMKTAVQNYATLEYDLAAGQRGSRSIHAEALLTRLLQTKAATVVNNNAAAVLLMLSTLCQGQEVIISRGQLVEIGGGFRVPDVMAQSGAKLVEVGTTNRTHLRDYAAAINDNTAAILVAHHSNFKIVGFTTEPTLAELAKLAQQHSILLLYDQGSGAVLDTSPYGIEHEPTVQEGLEAGCDVVTFSGDKLLGGPQAGILCGRADLIARIKKHPLARAVRADKMCLSGLAATLTHYLMDRALEEIPVWQMIARPFTDIAATANTWAARLQSQGIQATAINGFSTVGGGSLPGSSIATRLVAITHHNVDELAAQLRQQQIPIIGRIQDGRFLLDPRTVLPHQEETLLHTLNRHCV
ncbi:MAG: L-seryl-tRNA(Sec) selenium transferase [Ardenticatenaceae bacterium]|nr:L-seryl-tRNA(Sec) selenium transferase [Anaerolineales bacterium]MCB8922059.1 L-seryl-tRNA(Sec) selenium transferase [Ardenticatenaceae bacterium]MCB9003176.1 L-seryl-tRNA(Sec) selenium transferase [Ardenticatenaceae bacterium]